MWFLVPLACTSEREVAAPAPLPEIAPPAPAAQTPQTNPDPSVFARKYLVIVGTEKEPADFGAVTARLTALSEPRIEPFRLTSTDFGGLRPCWELLVARAFPEKAEAAVYAEALEARGVEAYVRATGAYVGDVPGRDRLCLGETWASGWMMAGSLLLLAPDDSDAQGDRALDDKELHGVRAGEKVRVYDLADRTSETCTVRSFASTPRSNGLICSSRDVVADLGSCSGDFALREGAPEPIFYAEAVAEPALVQALQEELRRSRAYLEERQRLGASDGPAVKAEAWSGPGGVVVVLHTELEGRLPNWDGEGTHPASSHVSQGWLIRPDGHRVALDVPRGDTAMVTALVDLDRDGVPEPMVEGYGLRHLWGIPYPDMVYGCHTGD
jgi:hypothetical protein